EVLGAVLTDEDGARLTAALPLGALQLHHVGAEIAEDLGGPGTLHHVRHVEHAHTAERQTHGCGLPSNTGERLSRKACVPSRRSDVPSTSTTRHSSAARTRGSACSRISVFRNRLVCTTASTEAATMSLASAPASFSSAVAGTSEFTSPISFASAAEA